jgi:hypothetical protein
VVGNIENAFSDFKEGGWGSWFAITQNANNNPFGAYLNAEASIKTNIGGQHNIEAAKMDWNGGFLSYETCKYSDGSEYTRYGGSGNVSVLGNDFGINQPDEAELQARQETVEALTADRNAAIQRTKTSSSASNAAYTALGEQAFFANENSAAYDAALADYKQKRAIADQDAALAQQSTDPCETKTPGRLIASQLEKQFGSAVDELGVADDLDKIVNALGNQLMKQVMGGIGGLLGASGKGSGGSRTDIVGQLRKQSNQAALVASTTRADGNNKISDGSLTQQAEGLFAYCNVAWCNSILRRKRRSQGADLDDRQ